MKIIKAKGSGAVISHHENVEVQTEQPEKLRVKGNKIFIIDKWGDEKLVGGGGNTEIEVEDYAGEIPEDLSSGEYELKKGKLEKKKKAVGKDK